MSDPTTADPASPHAPWRVAVIGGGIAGLAAAHHLIELGQERKRKTQVTLFEASSRLGGVIATEQRDGYLIERGPDAFITNKPWGVDLCRRLELEDELISTNDEFRRSLVLYQGRPVPVPEGFLLLSPSKLAPILCTPLLSWRGKLRVACECFVPSRTANGDESLAAFVRRRFGKEVLQRLVQPLVGGIYTADAEKLSLQATMPRFVEMERRHRSLIRASRKQAAAQSRTDASASGARYGLFTTFKEGLGTLVDVLRQRIEATGRVRLDAPVQSIEPVTVGEDVSPPYWRLHFADGSTTEFDAVLTATRSFDTAEMVASFDEPFARELRAIEYASSAVVISCHNFDDVQHALDAFGFVVPAIENRRVLAVSFISRKFPGRAPEKHVVLRTFVGGAMQPEMMQFDDDELKRIVREELEQMLGVSGEAAFMDVVRYERAMPQYHVGHLDRVAKIESLAKTYSGLELAGNAYHGVGIPDCIHSGEEAAERLFANKFDVSEDTEDADTRQK